MRLTKLFAILAIGALVGAAVAQGGGAGREGGQRGQRGMMMGGGGGMMSSPAMLLLGGGGGFGRGGGQGGPGGNDTLRADVIADLKLNDDQKTKIDALRTKQGERMRGMFGGGGGERPSREEMQKMMQEAQEATNKELNAILTPEQQTRLKQISIQLAGSRAVANEDVAKELGLSDTQKTKLEELQTKMQEANRGLFQAVNDGTMTREEAAEKREANNKVMDEEIAKVLTEEQRTKLAAMSGPKFKRSSE